MQKKEIDKTFEAFNQYMSENRIKDAIEMLLLTEPGSTLFSDELSRIDETYRNLVKYMVMGVEDPQRQKISDSLKLGLFEISDRIKHKLSENIVMQLFTDRSFAEHHSLQVPEYIAELLEKFLFDLEIREALTDPYTTEDATSKPETDKKQILSALFGWLWFGGKLTEKDKNLVLKVLHSGRFEWHEKCLIVSAVAMGLIQGFDIFRFEILFDTYERQEIQVSQRAFTGLLIGLYLYDNRLHLYPQLLHRLKAREGDETLEMDAKAVIFQIFRSKDTEKVTRKFQEEIMPDIIKHAPKLEDRLGLDQIISSDPTEDKNPKWEKFFADSPDLINKLEEITRMQLEGMDVFMSTFANLKHFAFFAELSNWFAPYHNEHKAVKQIMEGETESFRSIFMDSLTRSHYMCNSDKFSFCMSLGSMPSQQKEMMMQMFAAEMEGLKDMEKEEDILDARKKVNSIYIQYIQDLYRFFKLYPRRAALDDIYRSRFDFHNKGFMQYIITGEKSWRSFADFFFEKEYFTEALEIYHKLIDSGNNTQEVFEKLAYCYEKTGNYQQALAYYHKAELFDQNRAWNLRKIARCHWLLKNYDKAIEAYKEAEILEPENLHVQITIGNCYLHLKDYTQALNYYFKVELASPDNQKVMRPIAWCLFVTGKLDEARHYYEKVMEGEPNKYDYMNLGHVFLCMNQKQQAIQCYLQSVKQKDNSIHQFVTGFNDDRQFLIKLGIDESELPIIIDYLKYMLEK